MGRMRFSLRYIFLEMSLVAVFLGMATARFSYYEHPFKYAAFGTAMLVSGSAAIGVLFLRPVRGAIIGLILVVVLLPLAWIGNSR